MKFKRETPIERHPLADINDMLMEQSVLVAKARNQFFGLRAMKKNLEARLKKESGGSSADERASLAYASDEWLAFEQDLGRKEAIYEWEKDKLEVMKQEYQAQYLELKDNEAVRRKQGA